MPARLTIDQFIAELKAKTEHEGTKWEVTSFGRIRTWKREFLSVCCPLKYLYGPDYMAEAERRGMSRPEADDVIEGADNPRPKGARARRYRAQLLAATGAANV